jgi:hypothetical protein
MMAYLFLPKEGKPPYQTIVYFPGSGSIHTRSSKSLTLNARRKFILKSETRNTVKAFVVYLIITCIMPESVIYPVGYLSISHYDL